MLASRRRHLNLQRFHRRKNRTKAILHLTVVRPQKIKTQVSNATSRVCLEDVSKLKDYGLAEDVCRILDREGYYSVGAVVSKLKSGGSIARIGPTRSADLKAALASAGFVGL